MFLKSLCVFFNVYEINKEGVEIIFICLPLFNKIIGVVFLYYLNVGNEEFSVKSVCV